MVQEMIDFARDIKLVNLCQSTLENGAYSPNEYSDTAEFMVYCKLIPDEDGNQKIFYYKQNVHIENENLSGENPICLFNNDGYMVDVRNGQIIDHRNLEARINILTTTDMYDPVYSTDNRFEEEENNFLNIDRPIIRGL